MSLRGLEVHVGAMSTDAVRRGSRGWALAAVGLLLGALLVPVGDIVAPVAPAAAAPGDPGEPAPPTVVFAENFENAPDTGNPLLLANYVSSIGGTYTASPYWSSAAACNGFIMSTT